MKNKKILMIIIIAITLLALLITCLLFFWGKNKSKKNVNMNVQDEINKQMVESDFGTLFNNMENQYVSTWYNIETEDSGKYKITAQIPYLDFTVEAEEGSILPERAQKMKHDVNKQINDLFVDLLMKVYSQSQNYTILQISYATEVDNDILSLMVKCILKEGANAQRTIIKTFNYNIREYKEITVVDLLSEEEQQEIQEEIYKKVDKEIEKEKKLAEQGYNSYNRDKESEIYLIENATEFYIKDNILYIIYSYGNGNYTSTIDLIISEV